MTRCTPDRIMSIIDVVVNHTLDTATNIVWLHKQQSPEAQQQRGFTHAHTTKRGETPSPTHTPKAAHNADTTTNTKKSAKHSSPT